MAIDRRELLGALLAAAFPARAFAGKRQLYVSCRSDATGMASLAAFDGYGAEVFSTTLPARGHDAVNRPLADEIVVFARRPGNWFIAADAQTGHINAAIHAPEGRHFYGHGAFAPDGHILYATENIIASGQGAIGIYDASNGYVRAGEFPSGGIGPHDLALLPDGKTLLVANGGLSTHPHTGREVLNDDDMRPNLTFIALAHNEISARLELDPQLSKLSIRHLAVRQDRSAAFGCQYQGPEEDVPPLVGIVSASGKVSLIDMEETALIRMRNYVGSVAFDEGGDYLVATSPPGGAALVWNARTAKLAASFAMPDVCGVAPSGPGEFLLSSGNSGVRRASDGTLGEPVLLNWIWDNHLRRLSITSKSPD